MQICFRFGLLELLNEWVNVLNCPLHIGHARGGNCYAARTEDLECGFGIFAFVGDTGMKLGLIAEKKMDTIVIGFYRKWNGSLLHHMYRV